MPSISGKPKSRITTSGQCDASMLMASRPVPTAINTAIAKENRFTARGLVIDYDKYRVFIDGRDANLTQNEFKLVALLGRYAGRVLTYDYLIKEIRGPNKAYDNQILRVNMANIRRKIEENPAAPKYIFTEVGVGYRMAPEKRPDMN